MSAKTRSSKLMSTPSTLDPRPSTTPTPDPGNQTPTTGSRNQTLITGAHEEEFHANERTLDPRPSTLDPRL
eukprot:1216879-Rhodomonas_salina.1